MERLQAWFSDECCLLVRGAVNDEASMPGYDPFVPCMLVPTSTQILVSKVLSNPEWRSLSELSTRNRAANAVVRITEESLQRGKTSVDPRCSSTRSVHACIGDDPHHCTLMLTGHLLQLLSQLLTRIDIIIGRTQHHVSQISLLLLTNPPYPTSTLLPTSTSTSHPLPSPHTLLP